MFLNLGRCCIVHAFSIYKYLFLCQIEGFFLESQDTNGVTLYLNSFYLPLLDNYLTLVFLFLTWRHFETLFCVFEVVEMKGEACFIFLLDFLKD